MSFRIRRGVDADRQTRTFDLAEPVYMTDTGKLYIGDGSTPGGVLLTTELSDDSTPELSGSLDLNGNNIVGTGNINIDGTITASGNINLGDGAEDNVIVGGQISSDLIPADNDTYDLGSETRTWKAGYFEDLTVDSEINTDSIVVNTILDSNSNVVWTSSTNEVSADIRGSVYSQDSGVIVNAETGDIFATDIDAELVSASLSGNVLANDGNLILNNSSRELFVNQINSDDFRIVGTTSGEAFLNIIGNEDRGVLRLTHSSESDIAAPDIAYGSVFFQRNDINGNVATGVIAGTNDTLLFTVDSSGQFANDAQFFKFTETGLFGIGTQDPQNTLDVRGEVVAAGYVQFGSYTTTERDSLTVSNGAVIYNASDDRFQGFQAGSWINLDDGTAA